jgi:hypothetical protein
MDMPLKPRCLTINHGRKIEQGVCLVETPIASPPQLSVRQCPGIETNKIVLNPSTLAITYASVNFQASSTPRFVPERTTNSIVSLVDPNIIQLADKTLG